MGDTLKIFIRKLGDIRLSCPYCMDHKIIPGEKIKGEHKIRIICSCKHAFDVEFEYRKKTRKNASLDGHFEKIDPLMAQDSSRRSKTSWDLASIANQHSNCKIKNLSVDGIGLTSNYSHTIKVGDLLEIIFTLDNSSATIMEKIYTVRSVEDNYMGCEIYLHDLQDKDLAFYILS
ncbi:MAG: PilZ domain-containing protein [Proteobacteria bacterium]|nr:PilZ domain-containing protein [Pseudomonadota bacterium]MBU1709513.1 PilZ domain-containing protein [Pseudomonadota bacterium]